MALDQELVEGLKNGILALDKLKAILEKGYDDPEFGTVSRKPVISMMSHACEYLMSNVQILLDKYKRER